MLQYKGRITLTRLYRRDGTLVNILFILSFTSLLLALSTIYTYQFIHTIHKHINITYSSRYLGLVARSVSAYTYFIPPICSYSQIGASRIRMVTLILQPSPSHLVRKAHQFPKKTLTHQCDAHDFTGTNAKITCNTCYYNTRDIRDVIAHVCDFIAHVYRPYTPISRTHT